MSWSNKQKINKLQIKLYCLTVHDNLRRQCYNAVLKCSAGSNWLSRWSLRTTQSDPTNGENVRAYWSCELDSELLYIVIIKCFVFMPAHLYAVPHICATRDGNVECIDGGPLLASLRAQQLLVHAYSRYETWCITGPMIFCNFSFATGGCTLSPLS